MNKTGHASSEWRHNSGGSNPWAAGVQLVSMLLNAALFVMKCSWIIGCYED